MINPDLHSQRGASLVIGMILMLAISLISLVSAKAGLSQHKSLQANLDYQQTFLAADSALNKSNQWLFEELQNNQCQIECTAITAVKEITMLPIQLNHKDELWWQQQAESWLGGRRLVYLQSSEKIIVVDEISGHWDEYQREIYSSYFLQSGTLPGNRVLLHELWVVDRPYAGNQDPTLRECMSSYTVRSALKENKLELCGRLGWEQLLP